jgi:hypothetical protein
MTSDASFRRLSLSRRSTFMFYPKAGSALPTFFVRISFSHGAFAFSGAVKSRRGWLHTVKGESGAGHLASIVFSARNDGIADDAQRALAREKRG